MMPANENCYEPADETVFEVWATREFMYGEVERDWLYTQRSIEEAESVIGVIEDDCDPDRGCKLISIDIYETTRRRVGGKVYEAPGEVAE